MALAERSAAAELELDLTHGGLLDQRQTERQMVQVAVDYQAGEGLLECGGPMGLSGAAAKR